MASPSAAAPTEEKGDHLCLAGNSAVQKMLQKEGQNIPLPETVVFSDFVIKINRKEKEQTRVILLTDKAVYNLLPSSYGKCKRRIKLENIAAVTASSISDEFVLHVPDEYDYRFKSAKKDKVCELIVQLYKKLWEKDEKKAQAEAGPNGKIKKKRIALAYINEQDLKDHALTKQMARLQTREDILRRKQLAQSAVTEDSDAEDQARSALANASISTPGGASAGAAASSSNEMENLLDDGEKVKLEDFELLKVLGRGSFGKVMQVRKKSDGKIYAMKILKKRAIIARNQVEHTKAERKILQSLQHPFLMTLRYAFQSKEKLYFVLDYYQGGELFFHLKNNRRFSEEVSKIYVGEIALALGHLHSLQIIYRDLKPENILLDDLGHVCLTDFGLSKDVDPTDKAHTFCVDGDATVSLLDGVGVRLRDVPRLLAAQGGAAVNVFTSSELKSGFQAGKACFFTPNGRKECIELTLEDGRTLTCTPDHKVLTEEGWVEAQKLVHAHDEHAHRLICGPEGPVDNLDQDCANAFAFHMSATGTVLNWQTERAQCLALARLIGRLATNGSLDLTLGGGRLRFAHALDLARGQADLDLVLKKSSASASVELVEEADEKEEKALDADLLELTFSAELARDLATLCGVTGTSKSLDSTLLPSFVADASTPLAIVREFLGTFFGAEGAAPELNTVEDGFEPLRFCSSNESLVMLEQVREVLSARFGLESRSGEMKAVELPAGPMTLAFYRQIGFRYACEKQTRLMAAATYYSRLATAEFAKAPMSARDWLEKIGAADFFNGSLAVPSERDTIPSISLGVAASKIVEKEVFDMTVPITSNFLAQGVTVHNCGTPEYLAPEIVTGQGHDKAVDWWSLGILLYELTVGIPPFYSQNVNEMYNKIQHGVLRFPPFLSENCKSLIVGLLNRDPKKRLGSNQDIDDIRAHPFFSNINFDDMMAKRIDVPYKPKVKGNDDSSNFDSTFTSEPVVDSMVQGSELSKTLSTGDTDAFKDFTFQEKGSVLM